MAFCTNEECDRQEGHGGACKKLSQPKATQKATMKPVSSEETYYLSQFDEKLGGCVTVSRGEWHSGGLRVDITLELFKELSLNPSQLKALAAILSHIAGEGS